MCWQGFARFECGHYTVHEEACEYANDLDVPFWQKIQCPNYDILSRRPALECGIGKFYCAQTDDGEYLDDIFRHNKLVEERIVKIDYVLSTQVVPARDELMARLDQECNGDRNLIQQRVASDPQAISIRNTIAHARQEKGSLVARKKAGEETIHYARQFWLLHAHSIGATAGLPLVKPPLPLNLRQVPSSAELHSKLFPATQQAHSGISLSTHLSTWATGNNVAVKPAPISLPPQPSRIQAQPTDMHRSRIEEQNAIPEVAAFVKKERRSRKIKEEAGAPEAVENVRRSTRATRKKVNYAEDANSEVSSPSRPSSPVKTDDSAFSPNKSEASAAYEPSPVRKAAPDKATFGRAPRSGSSLGDMIKSWSKNAVGGTPTFRRGAGGAQQNHVQDLPEPRQGTPDTVILPMDDRRADAPIAGMPARDTPSVGGGKKSWLADPMLNTSDSSQFGYAIPRGPVLPPNFTSVNPLMQTPPRFGLNIPPQPPHGAATPVLTKTSASKAPTPLGNAPLMPYETPTGMQDPTKRKITTSSISNKKVRLSLPGEDTRPRRDSMAAPATPPAEGPPAPVFVPPGTGSAVGTWRKESVHPADEVGAGMSTAQGTHDMELDFAPVDGLFEMEASDFDLDLFDGTSIV